MEEEVGVAFSRAVGEAGCQEESEEGEEEGGGGEELAVEGGVAHSGFLGGGGLVCGWKGKGMEGRKRDGKLTRG